MCTAWMRLKKSSKIHLFFFGFMPEHKEFFNNDDGRTTQETHNAPAEETWEQRKERERRESVEQLSLHADFFLAEQRARDTGESLQIKIAYAPAIAVSDVSNLEAIQRERESKKKGIGESAKEKTRAMFLRLKHIPHQEDFLPFVEYLEQNIITRTYPHEWVKESDVNAILARYKRDGITAYEDYDRKKGGKVRITRVEEIPYTFSLKEAKKLSALLGKPNDPVEIIERLKKIGFTIDAYTLKYNSDDLERAVASPEINQLLKDLERIGVSQDYKYFGKDPIMGRDFFEKIDEFSSDESKKGLITDDTVRRMHALQDIFHLAIPLDFGVIEKMIRITSNDAMLECIDQVAKLEKNNFAPDIFSFADIQESGLLKDLLPILRHRIDVADSVLRAVCNGDKTTSFADPLAKERIQEIEIILEQAEIKQFFHDEQALAFWDRVSLLLGQRLPFDEVKKYRELEHNPHALACVELLREWGIGKDLRAEHLLAIISSIAGNQEKMELFLDPAFQAFMAELKEILHYRPLWSDIDPTMQYGGEALTALFKDQKKRDLFFSEKGIACINHMGGFNLYKAFIYEQLLELPDIVPLAKKLEELFDCKPFQILEYNDLNTVKKLANDAELQKALCSDITRDFFKKLRSNYSYEFRLDEIENLIRDAANQPLQDRLFDAKTKTFVEKTFSFNNTRTLAYGLEVMKDIDPKFYPLLTELSDEVGYHVLRSDYPSGIPILERIHADPAIKKEFFSQERKELLKNLKDMGAYTSVRVVDIECILQMPLDMPDLIKTLQPFRYYFSIAHTDDLIKLASYKPERMKATLLALREAIQFEALPANGLPALAHLLEKNYTAEDIKRLGAIYAAHKGATNQKFTFDLIPSVIAFADNEAQITATIEKLKSAHVVFDAIRDVKKINDIAAYHLLPLISACQDKPAFLKFIFENGEKVGAIAEEKRDAYMQICFAIEDSPSQEIQRLKDSLFGELLHTQNPFESYQNIENIFIKNNLPTLGKIFKVFETLYSPSRMKEMLTPKGLSPVLQKASPKKKYYIAYQDLLHAHIYSANRSLRQYAETLLKGEEIISKTEASGVAALTETEQRQLRFVFDKFDTLFANSLLGERMSLEAGVSEQSLEERYLKLREYLGVREGQRMTERIAEMFLKPAGLKGLDQMLGLMKETKLRAHERGIGMVKNAQERMLSLAQGDLLKGVRIEFIENILQNGSVAKEFLGYAAASDSTPFDTDVSMVLEEDLEQGVESAFNNSLAPGYGELIFAIKDRGQFQHTGAGVPIKYDKEKLELFSTGGGRHYGIRTGFPSTEIDFMIVKPSMFEDKKRWTKLCYEIAQNGYYIPITDTKGTVLFTPEMYDEYRKTFAGLDRYDGDPLFVMRMPSDHAYSRAFQEILKEKDMDTQHLANITHYVRLTVARALTEMHITLRDEFSTSILGAELLDIGSTGRNTNMPGDYDFDLTLKLDAKDFTGAQDIANRIKQQFTMDKDDSHQERSGYYQLRAMGVSRIGDMALTKPIDIDIGFAKKSDLSVFGTHDAVGEKLAYIKEHQGDDTYKEVVAAIVLCKRILKAGSAYKRVEEGGFGGIGVENWILANHGDIRSAFTSFYDAAFENGMRIPFETSRILF